MSEHWKSTPRYWCKHCACYVRDTKLERQNHEATARHQGAVKRALRDLHRNHEREERDKERARQEIARLNGVVAGTNSSFSSTSRGYAAGSGSGSAAAGAATFKPTNPAALEAERKKQREQLAAMGVAIPSELRTEMAMAGDWTVTNTRVVAGGTDEDKNKVATGVRKREVLDEEEEERRTNEEQVLKSLFKRPRKWGRDTRAAPDEEDKELDALLSGSRIALKGEVKHESDVVKKEESVDAPMIAEPSDAGQQAVCNVKEEPDTASAGLVDEAPPLETEEGANAETKAEEDGDAGAAPVVFKKRKAKGLRTK
ncbi:NADPH dehydrogenase [Purpureocillium takamizusanense]|uniref:NADPH dehydrogenase n=1 Tax=Purpureocillium takamizusanense TaxID=2060973 RepID=A0A9Q8VAN5_9HYPO|nr:NADPH dehydrogenase [Purpureocillium takamizusanense]UNI18049.1 NADPH dehydrogenase [Purpureocillium takamizusanense]